MLSLIYVHRHKLNRHRGLWVVTQAAAEKMDQQFNFSSQQKKKKFKKMKYLLKYLFVSPLLFRVPRVLFYLNI